MFISVLLLLVGISYGGIAWVADKSKSSNIPILTVGFSDYESLYSQDVKLIFRTPKNDSIEMTPSNRHLLDKNQPTKIIIHGVEAYQDHLWIDEMVTNYHTKDNYNIITVDWTKVLTRETFIAASAVNEVGDVVADFIIDVCEEIDEFLVELHVIGYAVGAQVGGAAGEKVSENGKGKIGRITGLDPTPSESESVLDKGDAEFVDVIHTTTTAHDEGYGTVDFFVIVNGSSPTCITNSCTQWKAHDFFSVTILDAYRFEGFPCYNATKYLQDVCNKNYSAFMGENVSKNISGNYVVITDSAYGTFLKGQHYWSLAGSLILYLLLY